MAIKLYHFGGGKADGSASDIALLGGKGAHLAEMSKLGIPVPPGFTVPTNWCVEYQKDKEAVLATVMQDVIPAYWDLADKMGKPFLVSVRSGAAVSCPGMMDTILNVGLTIDTLPLLAEKIGERSALDCYRRLIQMLGATGFGVPSEKFEEILTKARFRAKVQEDRELTAEQLSEVIVGYSALFKLHTGRDFPQAVNEQLSVAVNAVFGSWMNDRAVAYRDMQKIDHNMGTAVTVQAMVFGNYNDDSGSGVLFSRNPTTGENVIFGEFLPNAQGEDVVAGVRTPLPLSKLNEIWPAIGAEIAVTVAGLEVHYKDMLDIEFTVQDKKLYILQCRIGKRSPLAKLVIATQFVQAGLRPAETLRTVITKADLKSILTPSVNPTFKQEPDFMGIASNNGVVKGWAVITADEAVAAAKAGETVILVRDETDPDDIQGMNAAIGILTKTGGATSHAAVVARALNKPCVVGCTALPHDLESLKGRLVTIDGTTGRVWLDVDVPVTAGGSVPELALVAEQFLKVDQMTLAGPYSKGYAVYDDKMNMDNVSLCDIRSYVPSGDTDLEVFFPQPDLIAKPGTPTLSSWPDISYIVPPSWEGVGASQGWKLASTEKAGSLEEMLDKKTVSATPDLINFLGEETFGKLYSALKKAGFADTLRIVYPPEYILFTELMEG
jgi:pyruvate,orthophosphate dikinase